MMEMLKLGMSAVSTMKAHSNDPHLSKEDNAMGLAGKLGDVTGANAYESEMIAMLKELEEFHLPKGMAGFLVTNVPSPGTLGAQFGFQPYDLIYEVEGTKLTSMYTLKDFGEAKKNAFTSKGTFEVGVHNFVSGTQRVVNVVMPPGKPNAILGITTSSLPYNEPGSEAANAAAAAAAPDLSDVVAKGWIKSGSMYVSSGNNAYPILDPLTSENANVYVKIFRSHGGMMVGTDEYHPLYNYEQLSEPLYVEGWKVMGSMLVQSGNKYVPLPMKR
jgi:hypothetical protein